MRTIFLIVLLSIGSIQMIDARLANTLLAYSVSYEKVPYSLKKKNLNKKRKKLKRNKRKRQLKKRLSLNQNNRSPEARKASTYFILMGSAVAIAAVFLLISLPFWFAIPEIIGVVLLLFSIIFLIAAIVFLINGIIYLNKARAKKSAENGNKS